VPLPLPLASATLSATKAGAVPADCPEFEESALESGRDVGAARPRDDLAA